MALEDHIDDIAFSSIFEVDKIFPQKFSGSFSVGASSSPGSSGNIATQTIDNLYGEDVLPVMQFSTDETDWLDAGMMKFNESSSLLNDFSAICYTTASSIVVVGWNWSNATQTCYYRIVLISDD